MLGSYSFFHCKVSAMRQVKRLFRLFTTAFFSSSRDDADGVVFSGGIFRSRVEWKFQWLFRFSHLLYFKKTKTKSVNGTTQPSSSNHLSAWRVRARVCVPATSCADGLSQVGTLVSNLWGTSPTLCRPLLVGYLRKKRLVHTYTTLYKGGGRRKEVSERERKGFLF